MGDANCPNVDTHLLVNACQIERCPTADGDVPAIVNLKSSIDIVRADHSAVVPETSFREVPEEHGNVL